MIIIIAMFEPASKRFLLYQPNHGFGVELFILESAFEIARTLNRTLVLPPMPDLETTKYRRSLDSYFRLDTNWRWISTGQYRAMHGDNIDLIFHIMPRYRKEYISSKIRELHPVWLDNIEHLTSFAKMGFTIGDVRPLQVDQPMQLAQISHTFDDERVAVGISYIHGMVETVNRKIEIVTQALENLNRFILRHVPTSLQNQYQCLAHAFAGDEPYAALHWRRGYHIQNVAKVLENAELPTVEAMINAIPAGIRQVIIATDVGLEDFKYFSSDYRIRSFRHKDPQVNAVVDIALCIDANYFIGVDASTFSTYIAYVRYSRGLRTSTVLL